MQKSITVKYRGPWDSASTALSLKSDAAKAATATSCLLAGAKNTKCPKDLWNFWAIVFSQLDSELS